MTELWENTIHPQQDLQAAKKRIAELEALVAERALEVVALQEKEKQYKTLFEGTPGGLVLSTPSGRIISINEGLATMMGYTMDEFRRNLAMNSTALDFYLDPTDREPLLDHLAREGVVKGHELKLKRKDGSSLHVSVDMRTLDFFNRPHILSTILDITDLKQAEAALRANENYLRTLLDSAHVGIMLIDANDHTIVDINEFGRQLVGLKKEDITNKVCHKFVCPAEEKKCPVTDLGQLVERSERSLLDKDGLEIPIHKTVTRLRYQGRDLLLESFVNIQELKTTQQELRQAHDELEDKVEERTQELTRANENLTRINEQISQEIKIRKETEAALRDSEERFRSVFENNHAVMLLVDPSSGRIEDANPAAANYYGYPREQLTSMHASEINTQSKEDIEQELRKAKVEIRSHLEFKHRLADGTLRDVEVFSGPIAVNGRILLYSIIHDISKRKRMEKQLTELATKDSLTKISNRRYFMERAYDEIARSRRYNSPLSMIMIDIDYFKAVNDTHGHIAGDEVLKAMTKASLQTLRETDIFGRIGGEEFAAILINTDSKVAQDIAERLRATLAETHVQGDSGPINFTVSIGVTTMTAEDETVEGLLKRADTALYEAKRGGRNRVVIFK
ncbi:diguanylate cyclase [Desulfovibrio ferrophilus]|uniref:Diguanylate cyclase with PAS/PAC sensor n=1 Tax=Desulfovibrio ferrophilus TaxID=241368 RepID=A0A2Z6AWA8_9BACT|nr:diguanylate cyclase [Desulfovibrio ferrophilus]BBD07537.1 diguanylate cyclase with PAS/PAC sensor [Desulfovibrio ferrophilus]